MAAGRGERTGQEELARRRQRTCFAWCGAEGQARELPGWAEVGQLANVGPLSGRFNRQRRGSPHAHGQTP